MQVRGLVFVRVGRVVWATVGNHAVIKPCPSLFTAKPEVGFIICYTIVLLYLCYAVICGIRVYELSLGCDGVAYSASVLFTVPSVKLFAQIIKYLLLNICLQYIITVYSSKD